jgi:hypothetical protein
MRARYYDPEVGRFISEDPIGFEGGDVNLCAYASNNPILLIDPLGLVLSDPLPTRQHSYDPGPWGGGSQMTGDYFKAGPRIPIIPGGPGNVTPVPFSIPLKKWILFPPPPPGWDKTPDKTPVPETPIPRLPGDPNPTTGGCHPNK